MKSLPVLLVAFALLVPFHHAPARGVPSGHSTGVTGIKVRIASATIEATDQDRAALRMELTADVDSRVISAFSKAARKVVVVGGEARGLIDIAAGRSVRLAPPGPYLELEGLYSPLSKGSQVTITMTLFGHDGQRQVVEVVADVI